MKKTMCFVALLVMTCAQASDIGDLPCDKETLGPTGKIRDGYDTTEWLSSTWRLEGNQTRTFGCDEIKMVVDDFQPINGDYAYFTSNFGWGPGTQPDDFARFEFTVLTDDLINSFGHNDSFTLFRVFHDADDENTVMFEVNMLRIKSVTKPPIGGNGIIGDYWLAELTWINQKDGSTLTQSHPIYGDRAKMNYQWNTGKFFALESLTIEDKAGPVIYQNLISNINKIIPKINQVGLVDSSKPLSNKDQIVIRGPYPEYH